MASIRISDLRLSLNQIVGRKVKEVAVDSVALRYKRDEAGHATEVVDGVNINIFAAKGQLQTIKLPMECRPVYDELFTALKKGTAYVSFGTPSTLIGRPYAMTDANGNLISGVSCTATEVHIERTEEDTFDFDLDD